MATKRQAILEEVVAETELALPLIPVYAQRFLPSSVIPAIVVYTLGDNSNIPDNNRLANIRTEEIRIVVHETGKEAHENPPAGTSLSEKINIYAAAIEARFNKKRYALNGKVDRFEYTGTDISYKEEGEKIIGIVALKYNAVYTDLFA